MAKMTDQMETKQGASLSLHKGLGKKPDLHVPSKQQNGQNLT